MSSVLEKIQAIYPTATSHPDLARKLAAFGVISYTVDVSSRTILYRLGNGNNEVHYGNQSLQTVASEFNKVETVKTIRASQAGEISYPEFMAGIAKAGILFYEASLLAECPNITYYGNGDCYEEEIPINS